MCVCVCVCPSVIFAETLSSGDSERCVCELDEVCVTSLWPWQATLRALASLLTLEDPLVQQAATTFLTSAASHPPFRTRVSTATGAGVGGTGLQRVRQEEGGRKRGGGERPNERKGDRENWKSERNREICRLSALCQPFSPTPPPHPHPPLRV